MNVVLIRLEDWLGRETTPTVASRAKELVERVAAARRKLGSKLIVLGHHYQREDIIQFADERGDSFMLAQ